MKTPREVLTEENKRVVRARENRPDVKDDRPKGVLFSTEGSTGWGRKRDLRDHKKGKSEHNFADQHDRFTEEQV